MELKEIKPKIVIKKGLSYFEAKTSREDLENMLDGADKLNKYQIKGVVDKILIGKKVNYEKYNPVGPQLPINKPILALNGITDRQKIIDALDEFFRSALSYATVYRGVYVVVDKLGIYELGHGNEIVYYISGLARLMRDK